MSPDLGPRQLQLLRLALLHHGSLSKMWITRHRLARQSRSLARRSLVDRTETGSVRLTPAGRAAAEIAWSQTG